jgi:zinc D-Ala-D-Ala carboxypeptidase
MKIIQFGICLLPLVLFSACQGQKTSTILIKPTTDTLSLKQTKVDSLSQKEKIDYIMGKFEPAQHREFIEIPAKYRDEEVRYLRKEVLTAFIKMYDAAIKDSIFLKIKSATRNFNNQKRIWENKWTGKTILDGNINATSIKNPLERAKKILEYSSMPGTSRHHWGTDFDLNQFNNSWFESGEGLKLYEWLSKNAHTFGFCQPYTRLGSDRQSGYFEEKWHWTYVKLSETLTQNVKTLITDEMITGFLGAETSKDLHIVNDYMLGISPSCMTNSH